MLSVNSFRAFIFIRFSPFSTKHNVYKRTKTRIRTHVTVQILIYTQNSGYARPSGNGGLHKPGSFCTQKFLQWAECRFRDEATNLLTQSVMPCCLSLVTGIRVWSNDGIMIRAAKWKKFCENPAPVSLRSQHCNMTSPKSEPESALWEANAYDVTIINIIVHYVLKYLMSLWYFRVPLTSQGVNAENLYVYNSSEMRVNHVFKHPMCTISTPTISLSD
jgi:hypothetical protein